MLFALLFSLFLLRFCVLSEFSPVSNISFDCFILFNAWTERRYFEEFTNLLDVQVREMKSMSNAIRKLEGIEKFFPD